MTYHTDALISFVGALSEVTLLGNLTHSLTIKSVSGHAPPEIHAFQTKDLRKKFDGKLKGEHQFPFIDFYDNLFALANPLGDCWGTTQMESSQHTSFALGIKFASICHLTTYFSLPLSQLSHEHQLYITLDEHCVCS